MKRNHVSANNPIKSILSKFWAISGAEFGLNPLYGPYLFVLLVLYTLSRQACLHRLRCRIQILFELIV